MPVTREGDDHLQVPEGGYCRICDYPLFHRGGVGSLGGRPFCPEIFRVSTTAVTRCSQTVTDT